MTFDPSSRLTELAAAPSLLIALDFDGVLSPLQNDPSASRTLPRSAAALAVLVKAPATRCALISGRDLAVLRQLADPPPGTLLVGSHGAELDLGTGPRGTHEPTAEEQETLRRLDDVEHRLRGQSAAPWWVERKPLSRVFHSRALTPDQISWLHARLTELTAGLPVRTVKGHDIVEFAVRHATKATGLAAVIDHCLPAAAIYIGDDVTDEDAFAELHRRGEQLQPGIAIKVGQGQTTADARLADPQAVSTFLEGLAAGRVDPRLR